MSDIAVTVRYSKQVGEYAWTQNYVTRIFDINKPIGQMIEWAKATQLKMSTSDKFSIDDIRFNEVDQPYSIGD